jgi:hypothetical protein
VKKAIIIVVCSVVGMLVSATAIASKVNMPREGNYEFDFCTVAQGKSMSVGEKYFVSGYHIVANVKTDPPGKPFDRSSARCYGTYMILNGKSQDLGICEVVDQDGDKWWMEYHGNVEGNGGTYTAATGSGKYEGMSIKGEYHLEGWPTTAPDAAFQGCNHNKGTYKLK